jgi:hypothetical protein
MKRVSLWGAASLIGLGLLSGSAIAQSETEPNDSKALANLITLPTLSTPGAITGNSTSAAGAGLDYFRVTTAAQATPGFYRHRLICTSVTPGHTVNIRGLNQVAGVPGSTDTDVQTSLTTTTPPRFIQWYTSEAAGTLFVRVNGVAATTSDYSLDYEVQPVTEVAGPAALAPGSITITTVGQSAPQTDTDLWIYDSNRTAIPTFGNDDEGAGPTLGSRLTRTYSAGTFYMAISNFNVANNQGSPPDDDFRTGPVTDFPGVIANSSATAANLDLDSLMGGTPVTAAKAGPFDVVFVSFSVAVPVELMELTIE